MAHLLPDTVSTALGVHPRRDVHTCQLLEEQLRSVRDVDLRDLGLVLTRTALELVALEVSKICKVNITTCLNADERWVETYAIGVIRPQISQM